MKIRQDKFTAMVVIAACIAVSAVAQNSGDQQEESKDNPAQLIQTKAGSASGTAQERQLQEQIQVNAQEQTQVRTSGSDQVENRSASQNAQQMNGNAAYQQQERLKEGRGEGQAVGGANRHKGQSHGQPSIEGKSGPAGSKNKPQKSGR